MVLKAIADLLIAGSCYGCGCSCSEAFCLGCTSSLKFIKKPICLKCGQPTNLEVSRCRNCRSKRLYFKEARSLLAYEGAAKKALITLKYETGYKVIDFLVRKALLLLEDDFFDVSAVTFIPLAFNKQVHRGHNISEIIAKAVSYHTGVRLVDLLKLRKKVMDQAKLNTEQRQKNLKNAFGVRKNLAVNGPVLLVDDIYTTGATVNEACKVLKKNSFEIKVFTLARTL